MAGGQGRRRGPCHPSRAAEDDLHPRSGCSLGGLTLRPCRLTPFLQGTVRARISVLLPTGVQFVEGRIVKKALVAATMAVGLLLPSPGAPEACLPYSDSDPLVPLVPPHGHIVPVYDH